MKWFNIQPKVLLVVSLLVIALLFLGVAYIVYHHYNHDLIKNEWNNQKKITRIVSQSLNRYFETLKFIVENAVLNSAFEPEQNKKEDTTRFQKVSAQQAKSFLKRFSISNTLSVFPKQKSMVENWQVFKGLPELDLQNKQVAIARRTIARNILRAYPDLHYIFEMDANGDLVFLEPFEIQKNITRFNYAFRDYLNLVKSTQQTSISEGYISHDQNRTQIITVATPIFNKTNQVVKIFAASVSATTLRERIFRSLKESLGVTDQTIIYFIDRHGHVVANSSGENIYFPLSDRPHDEYDTGNLRNTGFFKTIHWSSDVLEKGNIWERATKSWQTNSLNTDYTEQYKNINGTEVIASFYPISIIELGAINWGILVETPVEKTVAAKRSLKKVFYGSGALLLIVLISVSVFTLRNFSQLENKILKKEADVRKMASQVAHDIRSPLAALNMACSNLKSMPEELRVVLRSAVGRINDIANNLISQHKQQSIQQGLPLSTTDTTSTTLSCQLLPTLIDSIVTEKRLQFRSHLGITIDFRPDANAYGFFANVQPIEFKRILSNILNNSIEAIESQGHIEIVLKQGSSKIEIRIIDTGKGIAAKALPYLGKQGYSFNKPSGSGLGLFHAYTTLQRWGGELKIQSVVHQGTTVSILLDKAKPPEWFVPEFKIFPESIVVIGDDDTSIHQVWQRRFENINAKKYGIQIKHFASPDSINAWYQTNVEKNVTFLLDYEFLDSPITGLDLIEKLSTQHQCFLVTSRYEETEILYRAKNLGIHIIPKSMAEFVPLSMVASKLQFDKPDIIQKTFS